MKDVLRTEQTQTRRDRVKDIEPRRCLQLPSSIQDESSADESVLDQIEHPSIGPELEARISTAGVLLSKAGLHVLTPRERRITKMIFFQGKTLKSVGISLHLHESRVCQIRIGILAKLKLQLQRTGVENTASVLAA